MAASQSVRESEVESSAFQGRYRRGRAFDRLKIFTGNANVPLAAEICEYFGGGVSDADVKRFSDGEIRVQIKENVRGSDVFVVQSTCTPVADHLLELLLMIDALKRASADRITAVLPYYGYARQDRKDRPRVPISAKLIASMIQTAGANRVLALDLHAAPIQGFFDIPVDHLYATPVLINAWTSSIGASDTIVVSPDAGGVERARAFAKRLDLPLAIIDKRREEANVAEVMHIIGDVEGKHCLMVDDIIDTAGTLVKGAEALKANGALQVSACATHGVLSGPAIERIQNSGLGEVVITNSIPLNGEAEKSGKVRVMSVAPLLARAIQSIHEESSVSELFI
jgi:ribose-phosphate pyrophosphokinase